MATIVSVTFFLLMTSVAAVPPLIDPASPATTAVERGLAALHGFNEPQAAAEFEQGLARDPRCAVCWWGLAISHVQGNYIGSIDAWHRGRAAYDQAVTVAQAFAPTPLAEDLLAAAGAAFRHSEPMSHGAIMAYVAAMRQVTRRWPESADAAALLAGALLFFGTGCHTPTTTLSDDAEVLVLLERALQTSPQHAGLHHYYIHARERSRYPERALPSARLLPELAPALGHLVHMPSHIYLRLGDYAAARQANLDAIAVDLSYFATHPRTSYYDFFYLHNIHFLWAATLLQQDQPNAEAAVDNLERSMSRTIAGYPYLQGQYAALRTLTRIRFKAWHDLPSEALADDAPPLSQSIAQLARVLAAAANHDVDATQQSLLRLQHVPAASDETGASLQALATALAAAVAADMHDDWPRARTLFETAITAEDALPYAEPWPWQLPIREFYAAAALTRGMPALAVSLCDAELARHPHNPYALEIRARALKS